MTTNYLKEDEPLPRQKYCCISFISPEGIRNCTMRAVKIRGVFETYEEAAKHAKKLQESDPDFNIYVGEVGKWLGWDPDPNSVEDQEYYEKELNDLAKGYKENLEKTRKMEQQRKEDLLKQGAREEKLKKKNKESGDTKQRLQNKLKERNKLANNSDLATPEDMKELNDKVNNLPVPLDEAKLKEKELLLQKEEELVKQEKEKLDSVKTELNKTESNVNNLDKELARMKELYDKMSKK